LVARNDNVIAFNALVLVFDVYGVTKNFPMEEKHSLTDQLRRAAVSVPSNIAEDAASNRRKECANFLYMAQGSLIVIGKWTDDLRLMIYET